MNRQPAGPLLVLYSGGTIGMQRSAAGWAPAGGFEARLRAEQQARGDDAADWLFDALEPPLDSANLNQTHWLALRERVLQARAQQACRGVLLLHGTDSLAYSAAALSFLLRGLDIPLLLTGSMLPAGTPGSDAWDNLFGALAQLRAGLPAGVQLYFHGRLLPGVRASKGSSHALDAFHAPARQRRGAQRAAATDGPDWRSACRPVRIGLQTLYPGLPLDSLAAVLDSGIEALLLECYGSGTGPADDPRFLDLLRQARARGVLLAAISQCPQGHVEFGVYAAGSALAQAGVISGGGMGREAALGKLCLLLGSGLPLAEAERLFGLDLCGELLD